MMSTIFSFIPVMKLSPLSRKLKIQAMFCTYTGLKYLQTFLWQKTIQNIFSTQSPIPVFFIFARLSYQNVKKPLLFISVLKHFPSCP